MIKLVHISDLHFGKEVPAKVNALDKALKQFNPGLVVITGDLTQRATRRQYALAQRFLEGLSFPFLVIPGNHDMSLHRLYERFFHPWKRWNRHIDENKEPGYVSDRFVVQGLNTVRRWAFPLDWSRGRVSPVQLRTAVEKLKPHSALFKVIAAHHPFWLPEKERHRKLVTGAGTALDLFGSHKVDLILSGHVHTGYVHLKGGVVICGAGSAVSKRLRPDQKNSFNLIFAEGKELQILHMVWGKDRFEPARRFLFVKSDNQWCSDRTP